MRVVIVATQPHHLRVERRAWAVQAQDEAPHGPALQAHDQRGEVLDSGFWPKGTDPHGTFLWVAHRAELKNEVGQDRGLGMKRECTKT